MDIEKKSVKKIFDHALEIESADDQIAYLNEACGGNAELRDKVRGLLHAYAEAGSFLDRPVPELDATTETRCGAEREGQVIDRYKLREQLGEGGFGVVWAAEQTEPVQRKVALKIIKPGMDTRDVIARFEAERQALAMMDHHNIARVLDAGTTEQGRPYFAMELIRGVPITEYCDENKLTVNQRLELFVQVCRAVQHAHQKGIIHRDIKPSNVLVTLHDGVPVPKIIDFGIAKALNQRLTDKTVYTRVHQAIGTLAYMSPEAAELSGLDMDTRADVYGLGVLLYELLTGTTPFDKHRLEQAALHEAFRIIREEDPPKASTRLSTLGERTAVVSAQRRTEPRDLTQMVKGDLDCILLMALEKDRTRRYESASAFAADIQRSLDDQPVEARPPSTIYWLRKATVRHRVALTITAVVAMSLLIGIVSSTWFAVRMIREREEAIAQKQIADETLSNLRQLIIEYAMNVAMSGELDSTHPIMQDARTAEVPKDWLLTLQGVSYLHRADNEEALSTLSKAIAINEKNVSAQAMRCMALFHTGQWDEWMVAIEDVRKLSPREKYEDFDELFLAYAYFYIDQQQCVERLRPILQDHPTWIIPRALLANAMDHLTTRETEDVEAIMQEALEEIEIVRHFAKGNPLAQLACMMVYGRAAHLLDREKWGPIALEYATMLDEYPEYVVGGVCRHLVYRRNDEPERAVLALQDVLKHGQGATLHWPAAGLFAEGRVKEIKSLVGEDPHLKIARAYVLALSTDRSERDTALSIFQELKETTTTWFSRHLLIQIPLLLQKPELAKQQCNNWIEMETGDEGHDSQLRWERESIEFLAGENMPFDVDSSDPIERFHANYQHGLLAFSQGDLRSAIDCLKECEDIGIGFHRWWSMAFAKHFREMLEEDTAQSESN